MHKLRQEAKSNRKQVLLASLVLSLILNFALYFINTNRILSVGLILIILYIYIQNIYSFTQKKIVIKWDIRDIVVLIFNFILVAVSFILILTIEKIPGISKGISFIVFFLFTVISFIMHSFSYYLKSKKRDFKDSIRQSIQALWKFKKKLLYLFLDYFKIAVQWAILAIVINVLVYSKTIPEVLKLPEAESTRQLIQMFTSPLSRLIQNTIVSIGMFYIFYIGAFYVYSWLGSGAED